MHQTFYIDIDEEITSIIERLKKSRTKEVVIVVPKNALLIQSIINLKLLKKEADKLRKEIIIVTQDKLGKLLVEKTGIIVEQKIEEIDGNEVVSTGEKVDADFSGEYVKEKNNGLEKSGIEDLGTSEYFDSVPKKNKRSILIKKKEEEGDEKILNKELVTDFAAGTASKFFSKKHVQSLDMVRNVDFRQNDQEKEEDLALPEKKTKLQKMFRKNDLKTENDAESNIGESAFFSQKADDFFSKNEKSKRKENNDYQNVSVGGKAWKIFFWFCALVVLAGGLTGGYLYLPKVIITISPKLELKSVEMELKGVTDLSNPDFANFSIPVKLVDVENEVTQTFDATGAKSDSSIKARGTITIYNEFSSSPQPLVATTRFLSESGKIFRLEKSVIVPGTTQVGSEIKPGVIEAQVIADEAGESFNIEATKFSIPGFKGSGNDKYNKIYAKSSKPMIGGGSSGENVKSISASDISSAKTKISAALMDGLKQKIKNDNGEDYFVLDEATNFGDIVYSQSAPEGTKADNFNLTGKGKASVFIFKKTHLEDLAISKLVSSMGVKETQLQKDALTFEFGKADVDFVKGTILIRVNVKAKIMPDLDIEGIRKDILGKTEDEFKAYMSRIKGIDNIYINYQPPFLTGKIPQYGSRVEIILDNN